MLPSFHDSIALRLDPLTCQFETVLYRDLSWSLDDAGPQNGSILVERFRTYGCKLLDLSDHKSRLLHGATQFGIDSSPLAFGFEEICNRLVDSNRNFIRQNGDVSLVLLLSPGEARPNNELGKHPTCMIHLSPLPFAKLSRWYRSGTELSIGSNETVPSECWPKQIKCRSRLPYFLSDSFATRHQVDALAVLKTARGTISDTSVANILIVDESGVIASPHAGDILFGCTLQALTRLLDNNGVKVCYRDIKESDIAVASEVILTGTSGGIWFASSLDGKRIGNRADRPIGRMLTELWKEHVGIDFVEQAVQAAN